MPVKRSIKVAGLLKEELSSILRSEVKDPRIGFVTITEVVVSDDLRNARVYVSVLGDEIQKATSLKTLAQACAFIQNELGARVRLKFLPKLKFYLDESWEKGARIDRIIDQLHEKDSRLKSETGIHEI